MRRHKRQEWPYTKEQRAEYRCELQRVLTVMQLSMDDEDFDSMLYWLSRQPPCDVMWTLQLLEVECLGISADGGAEAEARRVPLVVSNAPPQVRELAELMTELYREGLERCFLRHGKAFWARVVERQIREVWYC